MEQAVQRSGVDAEVLAVGFIDFDGLGRIFVAEGGDDDDADVILTLFGAAVLGPAVAPFRIGRLWGIFDASDKLEAPARRASGRRVVRNPSHGADHPATIVRTRRAG